MSKKQLFASMIGLLAASMLQVAASADIASSPILTNIKIRTSHQQPLIRPSGTFSPFPGRREKEGSSLGEMLPVNIDLHDQAKLQRGAKIFMNYCSGCHSLRYIRYNRMAEDLGLTTFAGKVDTDLLVNNLIFTSAKISDPIQISMPATDAREWFGIVPPDLSLIARERGAAWIYTYLKSFYADNSRPFGTNNLLVPDAAMPNVLAPLVGQVIVSNNQAHSGKSGLVHLILSEKGEMNQQQFDNLLEDLVTFLVYVGEPVKLVRYRMGIMVIAFLSIFLIVAYKLKKIYWKNI